MVTTSKVPGLEKTLIDPSTRVFKNGLDIDRSRPAYVKRKIGIVSHKAHMMFFSLSFRVYGLIIPKKGEAKKKTLKPNIFGDSSDDEVS